MVFAADSESRCIIYLFIVAFVVLYSRICKIMKRVKPDSDRIEVLTEAEKIVLVDFVREEFCLCDDTSAAYKSHHDRNPAWRRIAIMIENEF